MNEVDDSDFPLVEYMRSGAIVYFDRAIIRKQAKDISPRFDKSVDPFYPTKRDVFKFAQKQVDTALFGGHDARKWLEKHGITVGDSTPLEHFNTMQIIGKIALMIKLMQEIPEELQRMENESKSVVLRLIKRVGVDFCALAKRYGIDFTAVDEQKIPARAMVAFLQEWMAA
jgi:hypothetical protein